MFEYKYNIDKIECKTGYGSISIQNIIFDPKLLEDKLALLVLEDENLKHMFAEKELTKFKKRNIYKRFIPKDEIMTSLLTYVEMRMINNVNFYSFIAEGILGLVFRDIYNYKLSKGIIDVTDTLTDTHTGIDSCMYSIKDNIIILGEAKFYGNLVSGFNSIINDFKKNNIKNKLESLQLNAESSEESFEIVIKNLDINDYDQIPLAKFMEQRLIFAGFVLHTENNPINDYEKEDFYNKYDISVSELKENIENCLKCGAIHSDYEIMLVHLPVNDKKSLIVKIIEEAKNKFCLC